MCDSCRDKFKDAPAYEDCWGEWDEDTMGPQFLSMPDPPDSTRLEIIAAKLRHPSSPDSQWALESFKRQGLDQFLDQEIDFNGS